MVDGCHRAKAGGLITNQRRSTVDCRFGRANSPGDQADGGIDVLKLSQYSFLHTSNLGIDAKEQALQQFFGVTSVPPESGPDEP